MRILTTVLSAVFGVFFLASTAFAATPLVDAAWVKANLGKPGIVFVDLQGPSGFPRAHLPGAVSTDYRSWRVRGPNGTPQMMPPVAYLEKLIGALGIDNKTHVVLTPIGQTPGDMAVATRIYWTFKALGHKDVSILDGGLINYAVRLNNPLARGKFTPEAKVYKANPQAGFAATKEDVLKAIKAKITLVDARTPDEYTGKRAGRGDRPGRIPGSILLPHSSLFDMNTGKLYGTKKLKQLFKQAGVPLSGDEILYCHTGHRASLSWFVASELLGNKKARLYDASIIEWAKDKNLPMIMPK